MSRDGHLLIAYTWSVSNIGDIGITPGLLNLVDEIDPDLPTKVLCSQRATEPAYALLRDYLPRYHAPTEVLPNPFRDRLGSDTVTGAPGSAWRRFHDRWGEARLRSFEQGTISARVGEAIVDDLLNVFAKEFLAELEAEEPEAAAAITGAGFHLYNSGTTLNFGRCGARDFYGFTLRYSFSLILARAAGVPYGVNSQSIEALDWPAELLFRRLFADAEFVNTRDPDSLRYLTQRDLLAPASKLRLDSTFFFRGSDDEWADSYCAERGLENERFMTVTIRCCHSQPGPLKGRVPLAREEAHMAVIREFVQRFIETTGLPVMLCPEVKTEIETARRYIWEQLPAACRAKCHQVETFWTTEQAYSLYQRAGVVCSMEMHSVIMALSLHTPVVLPYFDENGRKVWMLEAFGLGDWLHDIDRSSADDLLSTATGILQDRAAAAHRIEDGLADLRRDSRETVAAVVARCRQATCRG